MAMTQLGFQISTRKQTNSQKFKVGIAKEYLEVAKFVDSKSGSQIST